MNAVVLLIGSGDVGLHIADGLLRQGGVKRLVLSDISARRVAQDIAMLDCCHQSYVEFKEVDALDSRALEKLLRQVQPDLIVQAASLISPWSIIGRDHPTAKALNMAGIGIQLPLQLPIVTNVMQIVRDLGWTVPVANVSMPDCIHPILATRGLAPTIGLGNVSIIHLRTVAALKQYRQTTTATNESLIRVTGHHKQVYDVMQATPPDDVQKQVRVYVGERGERNDDLAYMGTPFSPGPLYNVIAAASALPVLGALLPNAESRRFSAPGPLGLHGGYPVKIDQGTITLDLPEGEDLDNASAFNQRLGALDGVAEIEPNGTVRFTQAAVSSVRAVDPYLAEPLDPWNLKDRTSRLRKIISEMGPI